MPFATQAGTALVRAGDVERFKDSVEQHAVEKEWLFWMVNGVADPVILTDATNDIILQNVRAESLFKVSPGDSEGKRRAIQMNNFLFTAALSTSKLEQDGTTRAHLDRSDRGHRAAVRDDQPARDQLLHRLARHGGGAQEHHRPALRDRASLAERLAAAVG